MKKQALSGVIVIEFLIYFFLLLLLLVLTMHWISYIQAQWSKQSKASTVSMTLEVAHDLIIRDLRTASVDKRKWKIVDPLLCVWSVNDSDIGWECIDHMLVRYEGNYNAETKQWSSVKKSLIAQHAVSLSIRYDDQNKSIECVLHGNDDSAYYKKSRTVNLLNGLPL